MPKLTSEEVENLRAERVRDLVFNHYQGEIEKDPYVCLCDAYLAQEGELAKAQSAINYWELVGKNQTKLKEQLQAENQELKAEVESQRGTIRNLLVSQSD